MPEDVGPLNIFASHEEPLTELVYDLSAYAGLLIPERLHRGLLERAADRILGLLEAGGTVIAFVGGEARSRVPARGPLGAPPDQLLVVAGARG
ncbi:MAG: hypothetical protein M3P97_02175 [Actinomycetota bacterium]|nr:hypothetical protein [Actinomycetota bacterium]